MMAADGPDEHGGDMRRLDAHEPAERARRIRARNWALLAVLVGLVALFYALTIVRMGLH